MGALHTGQIAHDRARPEPVVASGQVRAPSRPGREPFSLLSRTNARCRNLAVARDRPRYHVKWSPPRLRFSRFTQSCPRRISIHEDHGWPRGGLFSSSGICTSANVTTILWWPIPHYQPSCPHDGRQDDSIETVLANWNCNVLTFLTLSNAKPPELFCSWSQPPLHISRRTSTSITIIFHSSKKNLLHNTNSCNL